MKVYDLERRRKLRVVLDVLQLRRQGLRGVEEITKGLQTKRRL